MRHRDAVELLASGNFAALGPSRWADLGCGRGTFTLALAELLAPGSTIYAVDDHASALRGIPSRHRDVRLHTTRGDFTRQPWPFGGLDGILMANSLHYVRDQAAFVRDCAAQMNSEHRFAIVEYDRDSANRWVPYPVSRGRLADLFSQAGYTSIQMLGSRPSAYQRAPLYGALITIRQTTCEPVTSV